MTFEETITHAVAEGVAQALAQFQPSSTLNRISYTIREASEVTGIPAKALRLLIANGDLHAAKTGTGRTGAWYIHADCLNAWLKGQSQSMVIAPRRVSNKARSSRAVSSLAGAASAAPALSAKPRRGA